MSTILMLIIAPIIAICPPVGLALGFLALLVLMANGR
jgi:hypothetical protein